MNPAEIIARVSWWLAVLVLVLFAVLVGMSHGSFLQKVDRFQFFYGLAFVAYLWLVYVRVMSRRRDMPFEVLAIAVTGIALRLLMFTSPGTDDLHRYVWEGQIQLERWNPYSVPPDDPQVMHLRDDNWENVADPHRTATQAPLTEMMFAGVAWLYPSCGAIKLAVLGWDIVALLALIPWLRAARGSAGSGIIYALSPLVMTAFAVEGHPDSMMLAWLAFAGWMSARRQWYLCGVFVGLAILSGIVAVILLPWLLVRHGRAMWIAALVALLGYMPYSSAGPGLVAGLWDATHGPLFACLGPAILEPITGRWSAVVLSLLILGLYSFWLAFSNRWEMHDFSVRAFGMMILLLPMVQYWYVAWVLIFASLRLHWRWIVLSGSMVFYFDAWRPSIEAGVWNLPSFSYYLIWLPFIATWAAEAGWSLWARQQERQFLVPPEGFEPPFEDD